MLRAMEFIPSKGRGQNFLVDPEVADSEAAMVDLPPASTIVEIGGGLGELTRALIDRGFEDVTVIEIEPKLAALLETNFGHRVKVIRGDALNTDVPEADAYVGNLPFSTSAPILMRLLERGMKHGVFLVQKEVAERLSAGPGTRDYGPLSVSVRVYGEFRLAKTVPPEAFFPPPRVSGEIVVFLEDPIEPQPKDLGVLRSLLQDIFSTRRKKLSNTMRRVLVLSAEHIPDIHTLLRRSGFPDDWAERRPEEISPEAYVKLSNELISHQAYMLKNHGLGKGG